MNPLIEVAPAARHESNGSLGVAPAPRVGAAVLLIGADLQHAPAAIESMPKAWRRGADVVNMRRRRRRDDTPTWTAPAGSASAPSTR